MEAIVAYFNGEIIPGETSAKKSGLLANIQSRNLPSMRLDLYT
jgi:hypothetical protein